MATDYTVYQNLYNSMNNILYQLQLLGAQTQPTGSLYSNRTTTSTRSFADTFQNAAKDLGVPESMDSIFEEAAERYNVPVNLLMAVGKAESGYNADAVSPVGALGVMQLMPATAASLGVDNAFDARSNIMGGAKYLSQMLQRYDGDIDLALAAYNAGSGNVEKYGGVPPFDETINYIRRIRGYMGEELTTGKTVESSASSKVTGRTDVSKSTAAVPDTGFTQELAEYFVSMMRLQMMSRVSSLGRSAFLDIGSDTDSLW